MELVLVSFTGILFLGVLLMYRLLLLTSLLLVSSLSLATTYYRWIDDKGLVHYSETPPVGVESTPENSQREGSLAAPISDKKPEEAPVKKEEEKAQPSEAEQRAANCDIAKENLKIMANNRKIKVAQEDGTERDLSDEEIQVKKVEMEKNVDEFCS